jgi:CheY-like chemotaxis protein
MGGIGTRRGLDFLLLSSRVRLVMTQDKLNVVLAEDNPVDVFLIRRALDGQHLAYELLIAKDGEAAIQYVTEANEGIRKIDLLLLDLNLPKRDGSEVLARLRSHSNLANVPVVLLTSSDSPQDRERCLRMGANRYFQKPSNLVAFMEIGKIAKELIQEHSM